MNEVETDKSKKLPGIYRHKDTGVEVELKVQPKLGTPLINAYIRSGFEYVGEKTEEVVVSEPTNKELVDEIIELGGDRKAIKGMNKAQLTEVLVGLKQK